MELNEITMPEEEAKQQWKQYNELIKKRADKHLKDMKDALRYLKDGKPLIDIYTAMETAGLNKLSQPRLAIARANWEEVFFTKKDSGRGFFSGETDTWYNKHKGDVDIQPNTFQTWTRTKDSDGKDTWQLANSTIKTSIPIIPVHLHPEDSLEKYYILWEPKEWETIPERKDPILLKRVTENLFAIMAVWDVTGLEQSIIRSR